MISFQMLVHNQARLIATVFAIAILFFLSAAQVGLLVGWCGTTSAIIRHADADIWVMAKQTPAFDYGTAIPRSRIYQVRTVPGVEWAEGMIIAWNTWQRPDGRRINIELIGLDTSCIGGPWDMVAGVVQQIHRPESVIVDELFMEQLGVAAVGDECEMYGTHARVEGISRGIRTFTASPFVFTSLKSARRYDKRYSDAEVTYVLVRCGSGQDPQAVRDAIRNAVPHVDVLTSSEFVVKTVSYWMLETGIGITVVVTAILGLMVSVVITYQSLFAITNENLGNYATLFAIGFGRLKLVSIVVLQAMFLGVVGISLGSILFFYVANLSRKTPIPLEMTPAVFFAIAVISLVNCFVASLVSMRSILSIDPVTVFRA